MLAVGGLAVASVVMLPAAGSGAAQQGAGVGAVATWGKVISTPGLDPVTSGGGDNPNLVSCASAGNCSAAGISAGSNGSVQGSVVSESNGVWGNPIKVPGLVALNTGHDAEFESVSCASPGNCSAGGSYHTTGDLHTQGFVVSQHNGVWGKAIEVPGLATLNTNGHASVYSVSCASPGNCSAGGSYTDLSHPGGGAFVVSESNGVWGQVVEVPGIASRDDNQVTSVSCSSAGNCTAGGDIATNGFVVSQRNGVWGKAIKVPGLATLGSAGVDSVSCGSAGNCSVGGRYRDRATEGFYGFVASESDGVWGQAVEVPGLAALNTGDDAEVSGVSCGAAGNCSAAGYYLTTINNAWHHQGFVVNQRNGVWGTAIEVPGLATLNTRGDAGVTSVSCASAGNCSAAGYYNGRIYEQSPRGQGFVVSERDGVWGTAIEVPGLGKLDGGGTGLGELNSVSCGAPGNCSAVGDYLNYHSPQSGGGFVVSQS
jgi:hypothetical protein